MAFAFRLPQHARGIFIRLENLVPADRVSVFLLIDRITYELDGFRLEDRLIFVENKQNLLEGRLLGAGEFDFVGVQICPLKSTGPRITETLLFHLSFFDRLYDFSSDTDIYAVPGDYAKPGSLAVFTHVYNDNTMLRLWERYYRKLVPARDLYVIDHGSAVSPKEVLSPEVSVVSAPRGPVDHRAISHFCSKFQRFLLAQYRWVLHVDADEVVVHARGWDHVRDSLLVREGAITFKAGQGVNLVHDIAADPALDLSAPISRQRHWLVEDPHYAKPILSCVPTTWREGFHSSLETYAVVEDPELWLIHLSFVDLGLHLEKTRKWEGMATADTERSMFSQLYARPAGSVDKARRFFTDMLEKGPAAPVPEWMRGLF